MSEAPASFRERIGNEALADKVKAMEKKYQERKGELKGISPEYAHPEEAEKELRNMRGNTEMLTNLLQNTLAGDGKIMDGAANVSDEKKQNIFNAILDMGLRVEVSADGKRIEVANDNLAECGWDKHFGSELANYQELWHEAKIKEIDMAQPGSPVEMRKCLILGISDNESTRMTNKLHNASQTEVNKWHQDLWEALRAENGKANDTPTSMVVPLSDKELESMAWMGSEFSQKTEMSLDQARMVKQITQKHLDEASEAAFEIHGWAGDKTKSEDYKNVGYILKSWQETGMDGVIMLMSAMGTKGTMMEYDGQKPKFIDQNDSAKQLQLYLKKNGWHKFSTSGDDKKLILNGHSMGGGNILHTGAALGREEEKASQEVPREAARRARLEKDKIDAMHQAKIRTLVAQIEAGGDQIEEIGKSIQLAQELLADAAAGNKGLYEMRMKELARQREGAKAKLGAWQKELDIELDERNLQKRDVDMKVMKIRAQMGGHLETILWADQPCVSKRDSMPLVGLNLFKGEIGGAVALAEAAAKLLPEKMYVLLDESSIKVVGLTALRSKWGKDQLRRHALEIAPREVPTWEQWLGIRQSKGLSPEEAKYLRRMRLQVMISENDNLLSSREQTKEMAEWGLQAVVGYIPETKAGGKANHFGEEHPEGITGKKMLDLQRALSREHWLKLLEVMDQAVFRDDAHSETHRLVPAGKSPLDSRVELPEARKAQIWSRTRAQENSIEETLAAHGFTPDEIEKAQAVFGDSKGRVALAAPVATS